MDYQVRHLQTLDVFRVARILKNCTAGARESIAAAFTKDKGEASEDGDEQTKQVTIDQTQLGFALFEAAVDQEAAIKELFAGLIGRSVKEFEQTPYDAIIDILGMVIEQDDLPGFLDKALGLASKVSIKS